MKVAPGKRSRSFRGVFIPGSEDILADGLTALSEIARSQHENGYGRVIEDRPGATAKDFFSQRTCTIAPHYEKIGTTSLGRRRQQGWDWMAVGSDRPWFGLQAMPS